MTNRCEIVNDKLSYLAQYIIYFFNRLPNRNKVIRDAIKREKKDHAFTNFGTWYVHGPKHELKFCKPFDKELHPNLRKLSKELNVLQFMKKFKKDFEIRRKILFTVCYCYGKQSVHFISFIYDPVKRQLIHFDPGYLLYPEGQKILVPSIVAVFKKCKLIDNTASSDIELGGDCKKYLYNLQKQEIGIQFNGRNRDAFCQSWTLHFLVNEIHKYDKSIEKYCRIKAPNRPLYLFKHFIIPFLESDPQYMSTIVNDLKLDVSSTKSPKTYLKLLKEKVKVCRVPQKKKKSKEP